MLEHTKENIWHQNCGLAAVTFECPYLCKDKHSFQQLTQALELPPGPTPSADTLSFKAGVCWLALVTPTPEKQMQVWFELEASLSNMLPDQPGLQC